MSRDGRASNKVQSREERRDLPVSHGEALRTAIAGAAERKALVTSVGESVAARVKKVAMR